MICRKGYEDGISFQGAPFGKPGGGLIYWDFEMDGTCLSLSLKRLLGGGPGGSFFTMDPGR